MIMKAVAFILVCCWVGVIINRIAGATRRREDTNE